MAQLDKRLIIAGIVFLLGLAMLIAGSVMLGIGVHKSKQTPPAQIVNNYIQPRMVYTASYTSTIVWNASLADPNSAYFKQSTTSLQSQIRKVTMLSTTSQADISVMQFAPSSQTIGVSFYTYYAVYDATTSSSIQSSMTKGGMPSTAYVNPFQSCSALVAPPSPVIQNGTTAATVPITVITQSGKSTKPAVTPVPTTSVTTQCITPQPTSTPLPAGAFCDASNMNLNTIFLLDVAQPQIGSLEYKLSQYRAFLSSYDSYIYLHNAQNWSSVQLDIVSYDGFGASHLGSCTTDDCWHSLTNRVDITLNQNYNAYHTLSGGLQYVLDNMSNQPVGKARNLIILSDGVDINDQNDPMAISGQLKTKYFSIGAVVGTQNALTTQTFGIVTSDPAHMFTLPSFDFLTNDAVKQVSAQWSCSAFNPTPAPPTARPTQIPLKTTPTSPPSSTTPRVTQPPQTIPNCAVDVTFLVDESQSMMLYGYSDSITFANSLARQISAARSDSRFAIVTFNSAVVYQSQDYQSYSNFSQSLQTIPQNEGSTDFEVGFNAARTMISRYSRYNSAGVRSVMIFLSDGWNDYSSSVMACNDISHDLRSNYFTEVIALGIAENGYTAQLTKQAIDYAANDLYVQSQFINVAYSYLLGTSQTQTQVMQDIVCKGAAPAVACPINMNFIIEVSELELASNIAVEKQVVNNLLSYYANNFGPNAGKASLVFFSSPDGLNGIEMDRSGILYQGISDVNAAQTLLNQHNFLPLGGASDIDLAMQLQLQVLQKDNTGNDNLVIFFARGSYDNASNCCADPTLDAGKLRQLTTMQGISIGSYPNKAQLDVLTGSTSIDGNSLIVQDLNNNTVTVPSAEAIQRALIPIINNFIFNANCPAPPSLNPPCQQYDDIVFILHADDPNNWNTMKQFTAQLLLPSLIGNNSNVRISGGMFVNVAVLYYYGQTVTVANHIDKEITFGDLQQIILNLPFQAPSNQTDALSQAYRTAGDEFNLGRNLASKTAFVITDHIDIADWQSAITVRSTLPWSFFYGMYIGQNQTIIPGQDDGTVVSQITDLSLNSTRSSSSYSNQVYNGVCKYYPMPLPPATTQLPPRTTPGPIPPVKVREIWPDITLLIDVSQQTSQNFENLRALLVQTFLNQFYISPTGSRFSVATFDANTTNVICKFNDIIDYWSLYDCLGSKLVFDDSIARTPTRSIARALKYIKSNIFSISLAASDYKPMKENYLYVYSFGASSDDFTTAALSLQQASIRTLGVDLSGQMPLTQLSAFGPDSYSVPRWTDSAVSSALSDSILTQTTTKQRCRFCTSFFETVQESLLKTMKFNKPYTTARVTLPSFFSDFYFIVDESATLVNDVANVKQFVQKFINMLTISNHRSRISIIPFSDTANNTLPLTGDPTDVAGFMSLWRTALASGGSNIGSAIANVQQQLTKNAVASRPSYIVYLVGAPSSGYTNATSFLTSSISSLVLQYNTAANYSSLLTNIPTDVYQPSGSANLLYWVENRFPVDIRGTNPMNQFFNQLFDLQEQSDSQYFTTNEVAADIVIFLDETGLNQTDFDAIKQYLQDFTSQFTVGPTDTQFALQAFNGEIIPEAGFHFYDCTSNDCIKNRITTLRLEQNAETTQADLSGAIIQGLMYFLDPRMGWREDTSTYSIIIAHADRFVNDTGSTNKALQLRNESKVYAIGTNGASFAYVNQFVNTGYYKTVPVPAGLVIQSGIGQDIVQNITADYKQRVYPLAKQINEVYADHMFLIDNTNLTTTSWNQIKLFLRQYMTKVGDFDTGKSKMSLQNFDSRGIIYDQSFSLNTYHNLTTLLTGINKLQYSNNTNSPDLQSVLDSINSSPSNYGITTSRPLFLTLLAQANSISSPITQKITSNLNIRYFTYALQYSNNTTPAAYLNQFLGSDYTEDFSVIPDMSKFEVNNQNNAFWDFNSYTVSEYTAWTNTYGSSV